MNYSKIILIFLNFLLILKKRLYVFIIFASIIILSAIYISFTHFIANKSYIIIKNQSISININQLTSSLKKVSLRNIETDVKWYDNFFKFFYIKIHIDKINLKKYKNFKNILAVEQYYAAVDILSDFVRITEEQENNFFTDFVKNNENNVYFIETEDLSIDNRVLLKNKTGKPVVFYRYYIYRINNTSKKIKQKIENTIKHNSKKINSPKILGFAGDLCIEDFVIYSIQTNGFDFTFKEIKSILKTPDIMSVNLECTITQKGSKEEKHFTYRAGEYEFKVVYDSPIDYVSCANNHAMDYGEISLLDTIKYLDKYKMKHSGSGKTIDEAFKPALINIDNIKLAYFSICDTPDEANGYTTMKKFKVTSDKPGIAYYDEVLLTELFKKYKDQGYTNIINFHTGFEYIFEPCSYIKKRNKKLIDIGADAVICHHPHVINGIEIYKGKMIAYSLGDFLFDIQKDYADEGIILYLFIKENNIVSWAFYPIVSHYGSVSIEEKRITEVEKRFLKLIKDLVKNNYLEVKIK